MTNIDNIKLRTTPITGKVEIVSVDKDEFDYAKSTIPDDLLDIEIELEE